MKSDFDNLDIMVGSDNVNPIERELGSAIEESSVQYGAEFNLPPGENFPQEKGFRNQKYENNILRQGGFWNQ